MKKLVLIFAAVFSMNVYAASELAPMQSVRMDISVTTLPEGSQDIKARVTRAVERLAEKKDYSPSDSFGSCVVETKIKNAIYSKDDLIGGISALVDLEVKTNCLRGFVAWYKERIVKQRWNNSSKRVYNHELGAEPALGAVTGGN